MKLTHSVLFLLFITGCISITPMDPGAKQETSYVSVSGSDQCSNSLDVSYNILNSISHESDFASTFLRANGGPISGLVSDRNVLLDQRVMRANAYVAQSSPETCYAAALAMLWRTAGIAKSESDFVQAIRENCEHQDRDSANYLQILSSISMVQDGKRFDAIETKNSLLSFSDGTITTGGASGKVYHEGLAADCPLLILCFFTIGGEELTQDEIQGQRNYYSNRFTVSISTDSHDLSGKLVWNSLQDRNTLGGAVPLHSADQILFAMQNGAFVIAGISSSRNNHVVIVTGVRLANTPSTNSVKTTQMIDRIRVIDPSSPHSPERWIDIPRGENIDALKFAIAIANI